MADPQQSVGPKAWAILLTIGGLYYVWTRVLRKPLPSFLQWGAGGNRLTARTGGLGGSENRRADVAAARERQQRQLELLAKSKDSGSNVRERTNTATSTSTGMTIQQQQQLLQVQKQLKQKEQELAQKKKKQRELYLKQKALKEKEEEMRRKDAEQGPGWQYREDPDAATAVGAMDPQSRGDGSGGYKAQSCSIKKKRRGG